MHDWGEEQCCKVGLVSSVVGPRHVDLELAWVVQTDCAVSHYRRSYRLCLARPWLSCLPWSSRWTPWHLVGGWVGGAP
jgi:hypothetical protein